MENKKQMLLTAGEERQQVKLFKFYLILPWVVALVTFLAFFIWGIIDASNEIIIPISYSDYDIYYGVMMLKSSFLCWMIWTVIGAVLAGIYCIVLRISYSYRILQIAYLQQLVANTEKEKTDIDEIIFDEGTKK